MNTKRVHDLLIELAKAIHEDGMPDENVELSQNEQETEVTESVVKSSKPKTKTKSIAKEAVEESKEVEEEQEETADVEVDETYQIVLNATADMEVEDMKEVLKEIGYSTRGKRETLVEKLYQAVKAGDLDLSDDDEEEETEEPQAEEEAEVVEEDNTADITPEMLDNMAFNDLRKLAKQVGANPNAGKRPELVKEILSAVGYGETETEEVEEKEVKPTPKTKGKKKPQPKKEKEEIAIMLDEINDPTTPNMTKARRTATEQYMRTLIDDIENGTIKKSDKISFLQEFTNLFDVDELKNAEEADLNEVYINMCLHLIDDEGELHPMGELYELNGDYAHCGSYLEFDETSGEFVCPVCDDRFDAE